MGRSAFTFLSFCVWLLNTNSLEKELLWLAGAGGGGRGRGAVSQNWLNVVCFSSTSR